MNELSIIFDRMNINAPMKCWRQPEQNGTSWKFQPGLVEEGIVSVLTRTTLPINLKTRFDSQVILAGRVINDGMADYIKKILQHILKQWQCKSQSAGDGGYV